MGHRRWLAAVAAIAVVAVACSQRAPSQTVASPGDSTTTTTPADDTDRDILYVQHALFGTTAADETGSILTLSGVDQVTTWTTADDGGVLPTADFIESWSELGLDRDNPQATFVPADPEQSPVVVVLSDPAWDSERRTITYRVRTVADPSPPFGAMESDPGATLPEVFTVATLLISQRDAPELPAPTPTTTTTVPPQETIPAPDPDAPPGGAPPAAPPAPSPSPFPTPSPSPTSPPPSGPAQFTFSPGTLNFPMAGGVRTLTIRNVGSGVGSWSLSPDIGTGITASPVGGYLFPGSSVTVAVQFSGRGPASDFGAEIELLTSNGFFVIPVVVG
jgi:hypothetical protein